MDFIGFEVYLNATIALDPSDGSYLIILAVKSSHTSKFTGQYEEKELEGSRCTYQLNSCLELSRCTLSRPSICWVRCVLMYTVSDMLLCTQSVICCYVHSQ